MRSKLWKNILYVITGFAFVASIVSPYIDYWLAQLWVHFTLQYTILFSILLFIALGYYTRSFLTLIVAIGLLINASQIIPFYLSKPSRSVDHKETLTIMSVNLWSQNRSAAKMKQLLKEQNADIVILLEYTEGWHNQLKIELSQYPYQKMRIRPDNFGMAVYSKIAMETALQVNDVPKINAKVKSDEPFYLLVRHPRPPLNSETYQAQKDMFNQIGDFVNNTTKPVIVVGDLNSSSFSYSFEDLINTTSLSDTRKGFGLQTTWPSSFGNFGITLDHFLTTKNMIISDKKVLNDAGSDHLPIYLEIGKK